MQKVCSEQDRQTKSCPEEIFLYSPLFENQAIITVYDPHRHCHTLNDNEARILVVPDMSYNQDTVLKLK